MESINLNFRELVDDSKHLRDLVKLLEENNIEFKSKKELKEFLHNAWSKSNVVLIRRLQRAPLEEITDIPYTEIQRNGIIYRIHGIAHGEEPFGMKLEEDVRNFITGRIKSYETSPYEDYVLEGGFAEVFGLDKSKEMGYIEKVLDRMGFKKSFNYLLTSIASIPFFVFHKLTLRLFTYNDPAIQIFFKTLEDIRYLPKARELYRLSKSLPEPLDLELRLYMGEELNIYSSEEMARFMLEYSKENNLKILHSVVGFAHESSLAYYLKNIV